ncbi:n-carbamoyl-l-amino acid hydrolase [Zalerion maritima]|uniref:N-carbamoyl-l-amino acid hydrolase n=1 Tax=Zalerion maritima TaxID=339359 RepID=A0AAD5WU07_9PEZI|nr:n-carbamoyl-l-amino acid hydrolase [Zalerion maritima]
MSVSPEKTAAKQSKKRTWKQFLEDSLSHPAEGDVKVVAKGTDGTCNDEFHVSKTTLMAPSPVIRACLSGEWKEAKTREVEKHFDPMFVKALLMYVGAQDYDVSPDWEGERKLSFHAKMFTPGEYYQIPELQSLVVAKFLQVIQTQRRMATKGSEDFEEAVRATYLETPDDSPRQKLHTAIIDQCAQCIEKSSGSDIAWVVALVKESRAFAADLVVRLGKKCQPARVEVPLHSQELQNSRLPRKPLQGSSSCRASDVGKTRHRPFQ